LKSKYNQLRSLSKPLLPLQAFAVELLEFVSSSKKILIRRSRFGAAHSSSPLTDVRLSSVRPSLARSPPVLEKPATGCRFGLMTGSLLLIALSVMIVGPKIRRMASVASLLVECVYSALAIHSLDDCGRIHNPRGGSYLFCRAQRKERFLATLPGAVLAVGCWIGLSYLLGIYFRHFANFNKTLWNAWLGDCVDGLAVLDWWLCHAGRSRT
jgi:hypothetical protein